MEKIDFKDFAIKYGGLKPNTMNPTSNWGGALFSSKGDERVRVLEHVQRNRKSIWTLVRDGIDFYIKPGDVVSRDRMGSFISKKRWRDKESEVYKL
tara:strand:+ start:1350 stop:1637 length:288 start_codon:yes stop_codon:yes gene_type:complete